MKGWGFNIFYFSVVLVGGALYWLLSDPPGEELALYGFAESNETEINYPAPIAVTDILVRPGQAVDSGQVLLRLVRRNRRTDLADEGYRIDELEAEATARADRQRQELAARRTDYRGEVEELNEEAAALREEIAYRRTLAEGLATIDPDTTIYQPLRRRLTELAAARRRLAEEYRSDSLRIVRDGQLGDVPYRARIRRLEAAADFNARQESEAIALTAPSAGLIGSLNCRVGEYKNAYANLLTFYEPHSDLIRGYLYEDLDVSVDTGDRFLAVSLKDEELRYPGRVVGLGSRIVEIPARLRKYPQLISYGREVTIAIPRDNLFCRRRR